MNRNEKNLQTRQKIVDNALSEFSTKSYGEASLNAVCTAGNISKGIIYHYFKDKNELYLVCVAECFDALTDYLRNVVTLNDLSAETALERYFDARIEFFDAHPRYLKLFCDAVMSPPDHLRTDISAITADFDALNISVLTTLLDTVQLAPDITVAEVVALFREYQNFVNARFQMQTFEAHILKEHEALCHRLLHTLLYGVIERGTMV